MKYSINPNNGRKIQIPNNLCDKKNIIEFVKKNESKKIIVIQGLGFVGAVMSIVCANSEIADYAVIGVDLANESNFWKIDSLNKGVFPIISSDNNVYDLFDRAVEKGNFYATYDSFAYSLADVIIVDINLDVHKKQNELKDLLSFEINLNPFKTAIKTIGDNCKEDVLILVETTVPPGTCEKLAKPIIEKSLKSRNLKSNKFKLGHSYERVMPGPDYVDSIKNFYRVFSGIDEKSAVETEIFLKTIISTDKYPLTKLNNTNATEMAKVLENSYRAFNIAFITEWSRFAELSNVNLYEVVKAIRMRPTHNNLMLPGIGVGGYCLTKDPLLASWAKQNNFNSKNPLNLSELGVKTNDKMPLYAFNFFKKEFKINNLLNIKILFLGVSYRSDVGDTRYSPVEFFYDLFNDEGADVTIHDPYVSFWEEKNMKINQNLDDFLNLDFNIIIITTMHSLYSKSKKLKNYLNLRKNICIFDTVGILTNEEIVDYSKNHTVRVLGRGDIN